MLEFKDIWQNVENEKSNNSAIKDSNETYEEAIAGEPQGNELEGRSQMVVKSISEVLQKAVPVLCEPFLSTTKPMRIGGVKNINQKAFVERFANNFFKEDMKSVEFMERLVNKYLKQDILWVHVDWESVQSGDKFVENGAKTKILDSADVFYDSAAEKQEELTFVAYRETVNKWQLKAEVSSYERHNKANLADAMKAKNDNEEQEADEHDGTIQRKKRKNDITIIRYYGLDYNKKGQKVGFEAAWVEGTKKELYRIPKEYPMNRLPFFYTAFFNDSNSLVGKSAVYFLLDNQKIQTGLMRGILDNLENANNEKIFFDGRKVQPEALIAYKQNKTFIPFANTEKMKFRGYNALPQYVINIKHEIEKNADSVLGTSDRQPITGSGKFSDDKANSQISISETVQVFSIRKLGNLVADVVKTAMVYSEWYMTQAQKMEYIPEGMPVEMFSNMDKVKILNQAATASTKANAVRELNLLLQQSKENGKFLSGHARKEIIADLAENLNRPMIADMVRMTDLAPSPEEQMQMQRMQEKENLEIMELKKKLEEMDMKMQTGFMKAENERMRIEGENAHKQVLTDGARQDVKNKSLDATKKTIDLMDGLEGNNSQGLEQQQAN